MKKKRQIITGCMFIIFFILLNTYSNKVFAKPNDGNPIVIDKNLGELSQTLPFDTTSLFEDFLATTEFEGFVQNNKNIINLEKKNTLHVSSSIVNDNGMHYHKTKDQHIIYLRSFTNYGTGLPEITFGKLEKVDENGEVTKSILIGETEPTWTNSKDDLSYTSGSSLYDNQDDTYLIPYNNVKGKRHFLVVDHNLTVLSRKALDNNGFSNGKQVVNRSSVDYTGQYWDLTYTHNGATEKDKLYAFKTSKEGQYLDKLSLPFIEYETIIPEITRPNGWWVGMQTDTFRNTSDGYIGIVTYSNLSGIKQRVGKVVTRWDDTGTILDSYTTEGDLIFQPDISTDTQYFFIEQLTDKVHLKVMNTSTGKITTLKTYPQGTKINFAKSNTGYQMYGHVLNFTGEFTGYGSKKAVIIGLTDEQFNITSLNTILTSTEVVVNGLTKINENDYLIAGNVENNEEYLIDDVFNATTNQPGWAEKQTPTRPNGNKIKNNFFYGILKETIDWAPAIKSPSSITIDIDDPDVKAGNQEVISNWLITGSKQGAMSDEQAVKVYDRFDLNSSLGGYSQSWLNNRMNRNPKTEKIKNNQLVYAPIDWEALGFDHSEKGPQRITYFVSDSQGQISSTSRWVNRLDEGSEVNGDYTLSASNFAVHVDDLAALDENEAKKLADMLVWNMNNGQIVDSGKENKHIVTINQTELKAITDAKRAYESLTAVDPTEKSKFIKPYPLTFELKIDGETYHRIATVFVTDSTTTIENDRVIYGFDFKESIKKVKTVMVDDIVTAAQASAWNVKMNWAKDHQPLPKEHLKVDLTYSDSSDKSLTGLNLVESVGQYKVRFEYRDGVNPPTINHLPTAYIDGNEATIHVRQVLLNQNGDLVVPTEGYLTFQNKNATDDVAAQVNAQTKILTDDQIQTFEKNKLMMMFDHWHYLLNPIIPAYYQYEGYIATTNEPISGTATEHLISAKVSSNPDLDFSSLDEYWVTLYFKPIDPSTIKPHTLGYDRLDIGHFNP